MRRFIFPLILSLSGILVFAGCTGGTGEVTSAPEVIENTVSTPENEANEPDTEVVNEEKEPIVIEPDNSYIYEDLCKVNAEYDETAGGAPIETIVKELRKESYEGMVLLSHTVEGDTDTVKYKVIPHNLSGKGSSYIICYADFNKDGDEWSLSSKSWYEWVVKSTEFYGSNWVANSADVNELSKLFENGFAFDEGASVYIHFKKNLNIISVLSNEDRSLFETKLGTSFGGTICYKSDNENKSIDFTCMEGIVNDDGLISFKLVTENGEEFFTPGESSIFISEGLYNLYMSDNADFENAAVLENLGKFEVTSESIFYDEWIKETGSENGNVSPELSWEKVDGATSYAIIMLDLDVQTYILHAYCTSNTNHINLGEMDEFIGPTPQSSHNYAVYVFALKEAVDLNLTVPTGNFNTERLLELVNKDNPNNAISYGSVTASYEYLSKVW
ncbi:MAG: hypothetical protein K5988_11730 [Lachnospiraceae bacterium]|nr:hypothetical protein [Lachnospiraceae bacterium]